MADELRERVAEVLAKAGDAPYAEHVGGAIAKAFRLDHYRKVADAVLDVLDLDAREAAAREEGRREAAEAIRNGMYTGVAMPEDLRQRGRPGTAAYAQWAARIAEGATERGGAGTEGVAG